jgi:glycosyltransferase involved in cell wall biosynthesis
MKKIRVLYIISTLKNSGPVKVLYNIIKHLDMDIFEPSILTLSPEDKDTKYDEFLKLNIKIYSLNLSRKQLISKYKNELTNKILYIKPDIIHSHGIRSDYLAAKFINENSFKVCNTIHSCLFLDYTMAYGKVIGHFIAKEHIKMIKTIRYPVSCSYTVADSLKSYYRIDTNVIQNGIDDKMYNVVNKSEKEIIRKKLGLPSEKKIFITTGLLMPIKDPINLIKAFKESNSSGNYILLMLGSGPLMDNCHNLIDKNIIMTGMVDNVSDYLKASDVFISASKAEGMPLAVLEAMATGLPVLLSDIKSHKEIFNVNENIGKLFEVGNVEELSKCINQINNLDLDYIGTQARKAIEKYFSAEIMSERYQELYRKL